MLELVLDEKIQAYKQARIKAMKNQRHVSADEAMEQILKYSPCPRENIYASCLINNDGALVLLKGKEKMTSKKMYYAEQGGIDVVFITTAETPTQIIEEAKEFIEKEKR